MKENKMCKKQNVKKQDVKKWILIITILILVISIIILWNNENNKIDLIFNTILIGLSINVISSVILVYLLEERDKRKQLAEEKQKRLVVYNRLITIIKEFNDFITKIYKATMTQKINKDNKILNNLYYDIDNLYNQISQIDLYKNSYTAILTENIFNPYILKWNECYIQEMKKLIKSLEDLVNTYSIFMPSHILKKVEEILEYGKKLYLMENPIIKNLKKGEFTFVGNCEKEIGKYLFQIVQFKDTLKSISKLMEIINDETNKNNFSISIDKFNDESTTPLIGSGLQDE